MNSAMTVASWTMPGKRSLGRSSRHLLATSATTALTIASTSDEPGDAPTATRRRRAPAATATSSRTKPTSSQRRKTAAGRERSGLRQASLFLEGRDVSRDDLHRDDLRVRAALRVLLGVHSSRAARGRDLRRLLLAAAGRHHVCSGRNPFFFGCLGRLGGLVSPLFFSAALASPPVSPAAPGSTVAIAVTGTGL